MAIGREDLAGMAIDVSDFAALKRALCDPRPDTGREDQTADERLAVFRPAGLMFSAVQTFREVLDDEQALVNNYVVDKNHPILGDVRMPGFPVAFGKQHAGPRSVSSGLGGHAVEVLCEDGFEESRIQQLRTARSSLRHLGGAAGPAKAANGGGVVAVDTAPRPWGC